MHNVNRKVLDLNYSSYKYCTGTVALLRQRVTACRQSDSADEVIIEGRAI